MIPIKCIGFGVKRCPNYVIHGKDYTGHYCPDCRERIAS